MLKYFDGLDSLAEGVDGRVHDVGVVVEGSLDLVEWLAQSLLCGNVGRSAQTVVGLHYQCLLYCLLFL